MNKIQKCLSAVVVLVMMSAGEAKAQWIWIDSIMFDHDTTIPDDPSDGLRLRHDWDSDLSYHDMGGPSAEIMYGGEYSQLMARSEPALYVAGTTPTIKIRIKGDSFVPDYQTMYIWASSSDPLFPGVQARSIFFISGEAYDSATYSKLIPFQLSGALPSKNYEFSGSWNWKVSGLQEEGGTTSLYPTSNKIYTILDSPSLPWFKTNIPHTYPWVIALQECFVSDPSFPIPNGVQGTTTKSEAQTRLAGNINWNYSYNSANGGAASFITTGGSNTITINLQSFINSPPSSKTGNCDDLAAGLTCLSNLLGGVGSCKRIASVTKPFAKPEDTFFGFMKSGFLAGYKDYQQEILCNNPFWLAPGIEPVRNAPEDSVEDDSDSDGEIDRAPFEYHCVMYDAPTVWDACFHSVGLSLLFYMNGGATNRDKDHIDETEVIRQANPGTEVVELATPANTTAMGLEIEAP